MTTRTEGVRNLFLDPEELPGLRRRIGHPMFRQFWDGVLHADLDGDRRFLETGIEPGNLLRHLPRACEILQREAFVHLVTAQKQRGDVAVLALDAILRFGKWDYFLEGGKEVIGLQRAPQAAQSLVFALEWIPDLLSEGTRREAEHQLAEKGCLPCFRSLWGMLNPERVEGWGFDPEAAYFEPRDMRRWPWILARTNLRAVPMSALGLGALLLEGRDPRAPEWLEIVRKSFEDFHDVYEKDGSYPEGTGYATYTSGELILLLHALERRHEGGWADAINWRGHMAFFLFTRMPSGRHPEGHVNFGDGGNGFHSDVAFWIARRYRDGRAQYAAANHAGPHRIFSPVFFDPDVVPEPPTGPWHARWFDVGWFVVTTGFRSRDFVVALRSGGPANHEHADRNGVILKAFGENLLVDAWHPPYERRHAAWALRTSPAHNTVLVDGRGHAYHDGSEGTNPSRAEAKVIDELVGGHHVIVTSDASQAYRLVDDNVDDVSRTLVVVPGLRLVVVVDRLQTAGRPAELRSRWFVDNEDGGGRIGIDGCTFTLRRPGAGLFGVAAGTPDVRLETGTFPVPAEHGVHPHLDVVAVDAALRPVLIVAAAAVQSGDPRPQLDLGREGDGWRLIARVGGRGVTMSIRDDGGRPSVTVT